MAFNEIESNEEVRYFNDDEGEDGNNFQAASKTL